MQRTINPTFLNSIANDPLVRPLLGGKGEVDLSGVLSNVLNVAIVSDKGGFVGIKQAPGLYEVHTIFRPGDGRAARSHAKECMSWMFLNTDCIELRTKVPTSNKGALWLTSATGLTERFKMVQPWYDKEEEMAYFSVSIDHWAVMDKASIVEGRAFHDLMGEIKHEAHNDDDVHYAYVGAAMLMAKTGNGLKAAEFYNRWASFCGYQPITALSVNPAIFEMKPAIVQIISNKVEIMLCQ